MMNKNRRVSLLIISFFCVKWLVASEADLNPQPENIIDSVPVIRSSFAVPDAFNSVLDSLSYSYFAKHARKGKCKKYGSENIDYPDSIYALKLESLPNVIPMNYNSKVKSFIDFYLDRRRDHVEKIIGLSKYYFPLFEDVLEENKLPLEFKVLPVIESALHTTVASKAGARGLWQFMPSTGRMYGLTVNSLVDERCDPVKSTYAAVRYLKDLYRIYGDWQMAIAAYNCGPGTVNRAIRRSGGKRDFWSISSYLPAETRSYVPIFIAANYVMTYYNDHNLCPAEIQMPVYTDTVVVDQRLSFLKVSKILRIPEEELRILNPQYRKDIIPGTSLKKYVLRLPTHYAAKFDELRDSIYTPSAFDSDVLAEVEDVKPEKTIQQGRVTHRVKRGDTLSSIANRYRVKVSDIKRWNGLRSNNIKIGQRLTIRQ